MNKLELFFIIYLAILTATYTHGLIFTIFRANKYEDTLAKKVAKEVKNED